MEWKILHGDQGVSSSFVQSASGVIGRWYRAYPNSVKILAEQTGWYTFQVVQIKTWKKNR